MTNKANQQFVDPSVTKVKFDNEFLIFKENELSHRRKGIFLLECNFPDLTFLITAPQLKPAPLLYGVKINFANYNAEAPSVKFINPHTGENLLTNQLRSSLPRLVKTQDDSSPAQIIQTTDLLMSHGQDLEPFICLPGIREYHQHPAHTGDAWELHKGGSEGTLDFILDKIWLYGITTVGAYHAQLRIDIPDMKIVPNPQKIPH